ncbi:AMP-binding protein [Rhodoligotrophos defluvii]|uniref:AMP-binding protein n=1 Tax=Rhodoligotrophos defluvii TaxID=2561934 RepID=UPI0010C97E83|nr:AMP-binding protein [Rhodoligotrophos defluvii]
MAAIRPDRHETVLRYVLEQRARDHPDRIYVVFEDDTAWTYAQALEVTRQVAAGLARLGVRQGDRVLSWLPNCPEALAVWFGINWLGAIYVPINTSYRGLLLEHVIKASRAEIMVARAELVDRLAEIDRGRLRHVVVHGRAMPEPIAGLELLPHDLLRQDQRTGELAEPIEPWHTQKIIYTSGTTGPSKGVLCSYFHTATSAAAAFGEKPGLAPRYLVQLPLFHAGGTIGSYAMLLSGGSIALWSGFRTDAFWDFVSRKEVTCCTLLGSMATFLSKQEPSPKEREHRLAWCYVIPLMDDAAAFTRRFNVPVYSLFNMTETSCPILTEANPAAKGTCGKLRPGVDARLVDENDIEVEIGEVGELILRTDLPWQMNHGYDGAPEATAAAWRNGWFHTGDAFRRDAEGNYFFVDRIKDAIRRRGENISSFEVEAVISQHPDVLDVAVVAVPSEHGENEVLACIVPRAAREIDLPGLIDFCSARMAHFMVPRFVRMYESLPTTPTGKVQKVLLRQAGVDGSTWDREAQGIRLRRERFG